MKNQFINARCTQTELVALGTIAQREDLNLSETVRMLIREKAKSIGLWPIKEELNHAAASSQILQNHS